MSGEFHEAISSVEEIIEEARNGRMFILVDHEDRENEGDLVIPAQMATPDAINFMATHGRGLICLALTRERTKQLGLSMMPQTHGQRLAPNPGTVLSLFGAADHRRGRVGRAGAWPGSADLRPQPLPRTSRHQPCRQTAA